VSTFRGRLLILGYPLLEIITIYLVAQVIGWGWTFLILLAGFPIGFAFMRNAGDATMRDMVAAADSGREVDTSRHTLAFVGGLLILVPGFWSDLVGLLLIVPLTQRLFRRRGRIWFEDRFTAVRFPGTHYPGGDVIQGSVIVTEESPTMPRHPPQVSGGDPTSG
jgi:UPF0716 protein FxsA